MLINVIMAVYNTPAKWINEAISSVIQQNIKEIKIIIINDCSFHKGTLQYLRSINDKNIKVIHLPKNVGECDARNIGLENLDSDCEYVAIFDSDDIMLSGKMRTQFEYMENNSIDVLGTQLAFYPMIKNNYYYNTYLTFPITSHPKVIDDKVFEESTWFLNFPSVLIRKIVFDKVGKFEKFLRSHSDYQFWSRCYLQSIKMENIDDVYIIYRVHGRNLTFMNDLDERLDKIKMLQKSCVAKKHTKDYK